MIMTRGGVLPNFKGFLRSRRVARESLRRWIKTSITRPFWSTARQSADSDDLARVYRFDLAQDSEMISPTIPI